MDWKRCIICQKDAKESLQCPANSKRKDAGAGYASFAVNVKAFHDLNIIADYMNVSYLDEGLGIERTLLDKKAVWHKSCRDIFSNTKLERAKKRKLSEIENEEANEDENEIRFSHVKPRRSMQNLLSSVKHCFFCEQPDSLINLHSASTFEVDRKVRDCAFLLQDGKLIAKLSAGDLIATEAMYHAKCLVGLYNRARNHRSSTTKDNEVESTTDLDELAFAELIAYIDEFLESEELAVLRLSDLATFYSMKQQELGIDQATNIHSTRFKDGILEVFPDLTAQTEGKQVLFALKHDIAGVLKNVKKNDSEAWHLAKAAKIIRKDLLRAKNSFNGTFDKNCQKNSVPASLKTLLDMIMKGPVTKLDSEDSQACLTVAQLILFNSVTRVRDRPGSTGSTHHVKYRECPLPIYTALKIHGATRDKSLIDKFYKLGMCISYDRLLSITTETTNSVIERYETDGVVCPAKLREGLFTTAALDNIDHNPSSTSSQTSFHGTAISIVQHPRTEESGHERRVDTFDPRASSSSKSMAQLPSFYANVKPVSEPPRDYFAPKISRQIAFTSQESESEDDWLENDNNLFPKEELDKDDTISWAAYRASQSMLSRFEPAIISLLPMFTENAHSLAMIEHGMKVIKAAVNRVNPNQIPVIALDQPLFALAKQIQWANGHEYGEDKFLIMLGGLRIEMSALKLLGKWLTGSGWSEIICSAGVSTQGIADSFLAAKHVTRIRRAHQETAACLHILMIKSYNAYASSATGNEEPKPFKEWRDEKANRCPQFLYWSRVLELELCCLRLVRSFREGDFALYIKTIKELLPWVYALDHQNYAKWLTVHLCDMLELPSKHPDVHGQFTDGGFVVHKTKKLFSSIALDQAHEQVNALVKGEGGAVGLTENPAALRRWTVAGPELARMVEELEEDLSTTDMRHHEQTPGVQSAFLKM